jgi:hypothetical protein
MPWRFSAAMDSPGDLVCDDLAEVPLWPGNSLQDIIPLDVHRFDFSDFTVRDSGAPCAFRPRLVGDGVRL